MKMNETTHTVLKYATVGGASILVLHSAMQLTAVKSPKEAIMPIINMLVGIAAFSYATINTPSLKVEAPKA